MDTIESSNSVQKNIGYSFIYVEKDRWDHEIIQQIKNNISSIF
jgi:nickel-dependent lactate racemase